MTETFQSKINRINNLIGSVPKTLEDPTPIAKELDTNNLFGRLDFLKNQVRGAVQERRDEISKMPPDKKRELLLSTNDKFILDILAFDENTNARTLVACNSNTSSETLSGMFEVDKDNAYLAKIIASNPNCSTGLLDQIAGIHTNSEVVTAIKHNPNVSPLTLKKMSQENY
jgi:hypothetical protein